MQAQAMPRKSSASTSDGPDDDQVSITHDDQVSGLKSLTSPMCASEFAFGGPLGSRMPPGVLCMQRNTKALLSEHTNKAH